ncbi:AMP-binding protein [Sphingobium sp. YR768]|uniref:AMP-binding protein n=1 Tax=Sphingobium sp. YR768 TaxID=1884365 RepID=UPI00210D773E|nr:AMP-binding protein [Sphingobium sp. YR768]
MSLDLDADYLQRREANFQPLTPINFLLRSAQVFADRTAIIYGDIRYSWREYERRCRRLASAIRDAGVRSGETVAVLSPNTPAMLEAHFGIPMSGAILTTVNTRLDASAIAFILAHNEARMVIVDRDYAALAQNAIAQLEKRPIIVEIADPHAAAPPQPCDHEYEAFLASADPEGPIIWPNDEFDTIALNYTSGTTGNPKGALYHHRGTYLNAVGQALHHQLTSDSIYYWTLPMFHCNGWCFPWALAAVGATHVCARRVDPAEIFDAIADHGVTHLCGAPTVLGMMIDYATLSDIKLDRSVALTTAGAAPPASTLLKVEEIGFKLRHVYGSTELHGVVSICDWHSEWDALPAEERSRKLSRQGVATVTTDRMIVADPVSLEPVPADGHSMGEILFRCSMGMKGYLKNPEATEDAFAGGWYHTGDLAVLHPDGYAEIKDRSKDIIISGGENISSIEIEDVLFQHPGVNHASVVPMKDERWGETPAAFVELKPGFEHVSGDELLEFCRPRLAKFKLPRRFIFGPIERTATGKVQKHHLRARLAP